MSTGASPSAATSPPRLTRSSTDRVVAGVAGGLGRYLGVDPVILRIAFVVLAVTGSGVLLYLIGWLVMPTAAGGHVPAVPAGSAAAGRLVIGGLLIALGGLMVINQVIPWFNRVLAPAILIALGTAVLVYGIRR